MNKKIISFLLCVMTPSYLWANQPDTVNWPSESASFDAPHNWPVSHPAPAVDINRLPAAIVFRALSLKERKAVQDELQVNGYYPGKIDGIWGPMTWDAVNLYASRVGIRDSLKTPAGSLNVFQHITN